jgi:hypothetical protein
MKDGNFVDFRGMTVRVNAEFKNISNADALSFTDPLEVGPVNSLLDNSNQVTIGTSVRSVGNDRSIDDNVYFDGGGTDYTIFDGTTGHDLNISGPVELEGRKGRDFTRWIDTAALELSGDVTWDMTNDRDGDLGTLPDAIGLSNGGSLVISGSGNTYTDASGEGVYMRGKGSFVVNNESGSATGSGNTVWIDSGVALKGDGAISASELVVLGGTVSPGNSVGTLNTGATEFQAGSSYIWEFGGGTTDFLEVNGNLTIADDFSIDMVPLGGGPFGTQNLMHLTGSFAGNPDNWNVNLGTPFVYDSIVYNQAEGLLQVTGLAPEPSTSLLFVLASTIVLAARNRRRA